MKALFAQLRRENAVVGQRVAIDFAWHFRWQRAVGCFVIAHIHLFVAFVGMKGPAERFSRRNFFCLQLRQTAQKHVDLENGPFISAIGLKEAASKLCQHVTAEVDQEKMRLDGLVSFVHEKFNRARFAGDVQRVDVNIR